MSPNIVEPLENNIDPEITSVWNSCAVKVPPIVVLPVTFKLLVAVNEPVTDQSVLTPLFVIVDEPIVSNEEVT